MNRTLLVAVLVGSLFPALGVAATHTVTNLNDSGPGADQTAISGNNSSRAFSVRSDSGAIAMTIPRVTVRDGLAAQGGGIYNEGGSVSISESTIRDNNEADVKKSTIIAGNHAASGGVPNCWGELDSYGFNLTGDTSGCTITQVENPGTDITGQDPVLGLLQDNGGPTETHALLSGSPAIDRGSCTDIDRDSVTEDQRGVPRPQGTACDISAYELIPRANVGYVVINEVAWMGTQASTSDEWIELYNTTDQDIDLTGWTLVAADGKPIIALSGIIPSHGFFLLERTDDTTVSDVTADQIYTGALENGGEILYLKDPWGNIIDTVNGDGGAWPAGNNDTKSTMERIDPLAPDSDTNWATNDGVQRNGLDANGDPINGTPKNQNSAANHPPTADAGPDQLLTAGDTVQLDGSGSSDPDGDPLSYSWAFLSKPPGSASALSNPNIVDPTFVADVAGDYVLELTVDDGHGGTDSDQVTITANAPPRAAFVFAPAEPTTQDTVQFTDQSTDPDGTVVSWAWEFGDGATSDQQNPTHRYTDDGTYTVTLMVTDDDGATERVSHEITVRNVAPSACFSFRPGSPSTQELVGFMDCSVDIDGELVWWRWEFGDGTVKEGAESGLMNPTHRYAKAGTYTVSLTVTDDDGATERVSHEITVHNRPPVACFTYSPQAPTTQDLVQFSDCSQDVDGTVASWRWEFGDGETSDASNPGHQYAEPGAYQVTLTVTDDYGATAATTRWITVRESFGHAYSGASWRMVSFPCVLDPADPETQLGDDLSPLFLWAWEPRQGKYVVPQELQLGRGYWLLLLEGGTELDVTGQAFQGPALEIVCQGAGWHMIGPAFPARWGEVEVNSGGEALALEQAVERGWLLPFVLWYEPEDGQYWVGGEEALLLPWEGYWVLTLVPQLTLRLQPLSPPSPAGVVRPDPRALGFRPATGEDRSPPPVPNQPLPGGPGWWVATFVGADEARFQILGPLASQVEALRVDVFNLAGCQLFHGEAPGPLLTWTYTTTWGRFVANGVYIVRLSADIAGGWATKLLRILVLR